MLIFFICLFFSIAIIFLVWRFASNYYSLPCPGWLSWMIERDNPFVKVHHASQIIEHLNLHPGMLVLDAGCGPGRVTIPLAKSMNKNIEVVAMDIQASMLGRVIKKSKKENLTNIQFLQVGLGKNTLEKNKFDRVILVTVIGEIPNQESAIKEIFKTLKPGGILSITETVFDPHYQSIKSILQMTEKIGFHERNRYGNFVAYTINLEKI